MIVPFPLNPDIGMLYIFRNHVYRWTEDHGWECLEDCPGCGEIPPYPDDFFRWSNQITYWEDDRL